jgi:predicted PurR-regulated permease PerM
MPTAPRWWWGVVATCVSLLLLGASSWLVFNALSRVRTVAVAVVVGILLTALVEGLVGLLQRRLHLPRWLAALLSVLVVIAVVTFSVVLMVDRALSQVSGLQSAIEQAVQQVRDYLTGPPLSLSSAQIDQGQRAVLDAVARSAPSAVTGTSILVDFLSGVILVLFVVFFLAKDGHRIWEWVLSWTPRAHRESVDEAGRRGWHTLTGYVRATVFVAAIDATAIGAAMLFLHVPLTASLTLITFIGALIPILGATVSGGLAVAVTLVTVGPTQALILLGAVVAVQQIEGNLLQPLIMGRILELHPLVTVLSVSVAVLLAGIPGAMIAVPVVAVTYRVLSFLVGRDN